MLWLLGRGSTFRASIYRRNLGLSNNRYPDNIKKYHRRAERKEGSERESERGAFLVAYGIHQISMMCMLIDFQTCLDSAYSHKDFTG